MAAQILDFKNNIIIIKISDWLQQQELAAAQKTAAEMIRKQGDSHKESRVCVLVIVENFKGWSKTGDWEDLSLMIENDQHIQKMAVVVEKKWEDLMNGFVGKGFREFPIENFQPSEKDKAIDWLGRV